MNYDDAMKYIDRAEAFGSKPGLDSITLLTGLLGNPQKKLRFIHVAGTNGKGSVSSFISNILTEAGYRTGLYTSPHLERLEERFLVDGSEITKERFALVCEEVKQAVDKLLEEGLPHPTQFEIVTAMAMVYFLSEECDAVVLEVGLGGRLDATNVIDVPEAAVITAIGYDHISVLGNSLSQIAFEKAGIIKPDGVVATYEQPDDAMRVINDICAERCAALHITHAKAEYSENISLDKQIFDCGAYRNLEIKLLGEHQVKNAALAVETAKILNEKGWNISEGAIRKGLYRTKWPGRLEIIRKNPCIIIDGAHNAQGVDVLAKALKRYFGSKRIIFIMGVLAEKGFLEMLENVMPLASRFFTVTPDSSRALPASELAKVINKTGSYAECCGNVPEAIERALSGIGQNEIICCFGSLYFIGEARKILLSG